jgi:hypothetical protein
LAPGQRGDPRTIEVWAVEVVSPDPGVVDREVTVGKRRWAVVEYSPGSGRRGECDTPRSGYVVRGTITYSFEDDREPLLIGAGEALVLLAAPRHEAVTTARKPRVRSLIDAVRGA